jgi:hypothetical protein
MWRRISTAAALSLVVLLIAACADDDSERRFANDPIPTEDLASQPTLPPSDQGPAETAVAATPIPLGQMLGLTGSTTNLFVQRDDALLAVALDGSQPAEIFDVDSSTIVAHAAAPDGGRVAVVTAAKSGQLTFRMLDAAGETLWDAEIGPTTGGSPMPSTGRGVCRIAWSSTGENVLVTLPTGGIVRIDSAGAVREIVPAASAPSPLAVSWSPSGAAIAYVDAGPNGSATGLYVASTDVLPVDPVAVIRPIEGRSRQIVDIAWPAGDAGILYAERAPDGDLSVGGDLFAISPTGGAPRLIASAGRVTQVGAVASFKVSPDGASVAYTVALVGQGDGVVSSVLRVKQISGPTSAQLTFGNGASVEALDWTVQGLAWAAIEPSDGGSTGIFVQRARADGGVETIYSSLPPASPVASPEAASPVP